MPSYFITIGKNEYNVNLDGARLHVNGKLMSADLKVVNQAGVHLLKRGKKSIEMYLNSLDADNLEILVGGHRMVARVETPQKHQRTQAVKEDVGSVTAPMPGLLVNVFVKVGDIVEQGQTLAVLESMKMQMQLRAKYSGSVVSVDGKAGDQIEKGKEIIRVT